MELRLQSGQGFRGILGFQWPGECWRGWNFGAKRSVAGEVVFCTAMMGYPESLTDPSFAGRKPRFLRQIDNMDTERYYILNNI